MNSLRVATGVGGVGCNNNNSNNYSCGSCSGLHADYRLYRTTDTVDIMCSKKATNFKAPSPIMLKIEENRSGFVQMVITLENNTKQVLQHFQAHQQIKR